jgi:hypothetical protein
MIEVFLVGRRRLWGIEISFARVVVGREVGSSWWLLHEITVPQGGQPIWWLLLLLLLGRRNLTGGLLVRYTTTKLGRVG